MSRGDFRSQVAAPRPSAAWAMVALASSTLWITQQLDPWVIALEALALFYTLSRRTRPHAWQQSGIALNVGMVAIVAVTIGVALRGEPSTIALAHFAALTQCLQLCDARPRRTEFLLVALALFQVVLAANLTDSVFFPPLVCAFLFATVWTLLVHTLRSEALEAGRSHELPRTFTPGLFYTTLFASGMCLALAAVLFVTLPRLRSSVLTGAGLGAVLPTAGFSDSVTLGELGRIRQDPRVVLRVETLSGDEPDPEHAYWRGLAFDTFDGTSWSVEEPERRPIAGSAEGGVSLGRGDDARARRVQRIVREPVASSVLFAAGEVREIHGTVRRLEKDRYGSLFAAGQDDERLRYVVRTDGHVPADSALRREYALPPAKDDGRSLSLPPLSPDFLAVAKAFGAPGADTDLDRVRAIEAELRKRGRYTDDPPDPQPGSRYTPVEAFLMGELAGHCEYFASAMVLVARTQGLPARLVNGFAGGRTNQIGDFIELTHSDAHAWVEVHFEHSGWVAFDPTPPDLRLRGEAPLSLAGRISELGSALELWWFQRVVGFDRADQIGALRRAWLAWHGMREARQKVAKSGWRGLDAQLPLRETALLAASALAIFGLLRALRRRKTPADAPPPDYARALRLLARRGLVRESTTPARDFARSVHAALPAAGPAFDQLTEAYLAERFGGRPQADAAEWLKVLARETSRRARQAAST